MDIILDNSALSLLYCKRRFQLTVLRGLKADASEPLQFGSAFHKVIEYTDKGASVIESIKRVQEEILDIDLDLLMKATLYFNQRGTPRHEAIEIDGNKAIEVKFKWLYKQIILSNGQIANIYLCGTIDRIELDTTNDILIIRDFKTAGDPTEYLAKKKLDDYMMSFQLPFYVFALFYGNILPPKYQAYLKDRRYRVEFTFVFYNIKPEPQTKDLIRQAFPDDFIHNEVPLIINNRAIEAANIMTFGDKSAPHDGMNVYKGCTFCPYKIACLCMGTEREEEFLARFTQEEYNPLNFR